MAIGPGRWTSDSNRPLAIPCFDGPPRAYSAAGFDRSPNRADTPVRPYAYSGASSEGTPIG